MTLQGDPTGTWPSFQQGSGYTLKSFYDIDPTVIGDLMAFIEANPPKIPITQVTGFTNIVPNIAVVSSQGSTTQTTYTNSISGSNGPIISGLPDGKYVILFGASAKISSVTTNAYMSVSIDGVTAVDSDGSYVDGTSHAGLVNGLVKTLSGAPAGGHTLQNQYRVDAFTGSYDMRWMIAIRITGA